jgi:hypothetical protein
MSEKVVLPKFDLPGQGPHPAVLAVRVCAGVLAVSLIFLGVAMWRQHSLQLAAEARAQALIAERAAEAAAAAEAAKARAAEAAAKVEAAKLAAAARNTTPKAEASKTTVADAGAAGATAGTGASRRHGHRHGGATALKATRSKGLAKSDDKKPARPGSKRDDAAIDKLLASFK